MARVVHEERWNFHIDLLHAQLTGDETLGHILTDWAWQALAEKMDDVEKYMALDELAGERYETYIVLVNPETGALINADVLVQIVDAEEENG